MVLCDIEEQEGNDEDGEGREERMVKVLKLNKKRVILSYPFKS